MAQQAEVLAAKPNDLSPAPPSHMPLHVPIQLKEM